MQILIIVHLYGISALKNSLIKLKTYKKEH